LTAKLGSGAQFSTVARWHSYSLGHMHLMLSLVLSAASSLRGASRALKIMFESVNINKPVPSWYTLRLWLLRLGYYKLTRKKTIASDWIWIIDHTIQCGKEKCLAILGIRQSKLPVAETILNHEDVEPLALYPVKSSNGDIVYEQLEKTIAVTGVPRQIIADGGTDIKRGVNRFCSAHPRTCYTYDIKHKAAAVLKEHLNSDDAWDDFTRKAAMASKQLQQTELSALAPPNQRTKARYMNIDRLVKWAHETLLYMEQNRHYDPQRLESKLGWLREFDVQIDLWRELIQMIETTVDFIRIQGFYNKAHIDLDQMTRSKINYSKVDAVRQELLSYIEAESAKADPDERLLGSSEVIESVFGRLKYLEKDQSKSGFTVLLLGLAASVSSTTIDVVQKAVESVPTKKVFRWFKDNIGQSVQSERKEIKRIARQSEQFWDYNHTVALE
jgi:hypothetical protein